MSYRGHRDYRISFVTSWSSPVPRSCSPFDRSNEGPPRAVNESMSPVPTMTRPEVQHTPESSSRCSAEPRELRGRVSILVCDVHPQGLSPASGEQAVNRLNGARGHALIDSFDEPATDFARRSAEITGSSTDLSDSILLLRSPMSTPEYDLRTRKKSDASPDTSLRLSDKPRQPRRRTGDRGRGSRGQIRRGGHDVGGDFCDDGPRCRRSRGGDLRGGR